MSIFDNPDGLNSDLRGIGVVVPIYDFSREVEYTRVRMIEGQA